MIGTVIQLAAGIVILGLLVLVHELGHFIAAKALGIRVLTFSIGFGRPLLRKNAGGTEYRISAIPFGGFVHMAGEHPEDVREKADDEYPSRPIWQRATVACAGPAANYAFSIAVLWISFMAGVNREVFLETPVVGAVADSSAAHAAGFTAGDSIISINGSPVRTWEDIDRQFTRQDGEYRFEIVRGNTAVSLSITVPVLKEYGVPADRTGGLLPPLPPIVGAVNPASPAEKAGLLQGDEVTAIDGDTMFSWYQLSHTISSFDTAKGDISISVKRGDSVFTCAIAPRFDTQLERYIVGITVGAPPSHIVRSGPLAAVPKALDRTWEYTTMIFDIVAKLFTKKVSPKQLAGPLGIVQMSGMAALAGLSSILGFMALIGINLAVLNMFPLIITDGGVLLFLLLEAIRGRSLSKKSMELFNRVAIAFFIGLFLFVTFNDIQRVPLFFRFLSK